jgi:MFS transporter, ACS family, D-galactonate transporter
LRSGPAIPVALHATYKWFPNELRTLPTAIIVQGGALGVMIALPLLNWVIVRYSWHWAFGALGFVGLIWCALWLAFGREGSLAAGPAPGRPRPADRVSYGALLSSPTILGCWAAAFGANWGLSQALSWQGAFLIKGLGLTQGSIGILGALPSGGTVIAMLAAGWFSQRLLSRGVSSRLARGVFAGLGVALGGAALVAMPYLPGITAKVLMTTLGVALPSVIYVIGNAVVAEVTPAAQRGALLAIGTAIGTSAGLMAPYVMGSLVQDAATPLDGFNIGYVVCGWIMLVCGAIGMALIRPEREASRWTAMPVAATPAFARR